ncbi:unnamed protein product [Notodromas monacha]|uniref:Cell morphogenesis central region domain-containing protein n=1 Tax=Notodromas monacha TaxID=399045 RepID=A0A7R9GJK6_9CRUS|nr:unnamed protein product [Notodromas monacha]CAG0923770.1 unnamed protein product [Notodromas monacha]
MKWLRLCIPSNNTIFIKAVSETLGRNEPHLTLEFLEECIQGFRASTIELKHLCLEYMTPWLPNLTRFCKHSDDTKRQRVAVILDKLITLTIEEEEMYPSIQAKIWGNIGAVSDLIDMVLDSFLKRSVTGGPSSMQAEIMADTAVALAAANTQLVSRKVISRLCRVLEKTCASPTAILEQHLMWDDIAILARYLLMLSFNNCLDVASHLPFLFHIVTFLVCTGSLSLRASIHGLVINTIHSLCTCTSPQFSEERKRVLRMSLDEYSLAKFYSLFGISKVKSPAVMAFRSSYRNAGIGERFGPDRSLGGSAPDREKISLQSLEIIADSLLEIMEASFAVLRGECTMGPRHTADSTWGHCCMKDIPESNWLQQWTALARSFALRYNPALQPRALIVFGCISKSASDTDVKQLLRILLKALESFSDITLIEAIVMCLTRLQPLLRRDSPIHRALFWVALSVLQLDEVSLYSAGLALLEMNQPLETLMMQTREPLEWYFKQLDHAMGMSFKANFHFALVGHLLKGFRHPNHCTVGRTARVLTMLLAIVARPHQRDKFEPLETLMMQTREPLEWYFKQLDHAMGMSFKANFHFALVGHLLKGFRHPNHCTVGRTARVLTMLLAIVARPHQRDKFEVTEESVAYLAALLPVSEEVRSRCRLRHPVEEQIYLVTANKRAAGMNGDDGAGGGVFERHSASHTCSVDTVKQCLLVGTKVDNFKSSRSASIPGSGVARRHNHRFAASWSHQQHATAKKDAGPCPSDKSGGGGGSGGMPRASSVCRLDVVQSQCANGCYHPLVIIPDILAFCPVLLSDK